MELAAHGPSYFGVLAGEVVDLRSISTVSRCGSRALLILCRSSRVFWLAELQTGGAVELKPGDELAVRCLNGNCVFLRLALYRQPPQRGHGVTGQTFGRTFSCPRPFPQLRLAVQPQITGSAEPDTKHEVHIKIANPLPYAAQVVVDWKLADYFGKPIVEKSEKVKLEPHAVTTIAHPFTAESDARAYQLDVKTRARRRIPAACDAPNRDDQTERLGQAGVSAQPGRANGHAVP